MWMTQIAAGVYAVYTRAENGAVKPLGLYALEDDVQKYVQRQLALVRKAADKSRRL